ncbi:hypothetical protein U1Q18_011190 [Sarracenia purpurea var. burkii]
MPYQTFENVLDAFSEYLVLTNTFPSYNRGLIWGLLSSILLFRVVAIGGLSVVSSAANVVCVGFFVFSAVLFSIFLLIGGSHLSPRSDKRSGLAWYLSPSSGSLSRSIRAVLVVKVLYDLFLMGSGGVKGLGSGWWAQPSLMLGLHPA